MLSKLMFLEKVQNLIIRYDRALGIPDSYIRRDVLRVLSKHDRTLRGLVEEVEERYGRFVRVYTPRFLYILQEMIRNKEIFETNPVSSSQELADKSYTITQKGREALQRIEREGVK